MASVATLWSTSVDFSAAISEFPGVYDSTAGVTITNMYGTNGAYSKTDTGASYTNTDGKIAIASTAGITEDQYIWVVWSGSNGGVDGYFRVTSLVTNTSITLGDVLESGVTEATADDTVDYYVGGIADADDAANINALQDFIGPACGATSGDATNNLDILWHASSAITLSETVDIDNITGSATTRVYVIGTDSSFVDDGVINVELTDATGVGGGLIEFIGTLRAITFKNIDFDAASNATYAIDAGIDTLIGIVFQNCRMQRAVSYGALTGANVFNEAISFIGCEVDNNGGGGIIAWIAGRGHTLVNGCNIHDNSGDGIKAGLSLGCIGTKIWGNTGVGIHANSDLTLRTISDNTIYDNGGDGMYINATEGSLGSIYNNTSSGNDGYGYNLNDMGPGILNFFGFNHSFGNSTAPCDIATTDALFEVLFNGENVVGDPDFVDLIDFIPESTSPLIDAGVGGTGDTIGALCATAGGSGGTTGISKSRAFGGI